VSDQYPHVPTNLEQQHKLAKDLLRDARDGDPAALARLKAVRSDAGATRPLQLADAQLALARETGFDSWPMFVERLQQRDIKAFCDAVSHGEVSTVTRLLGLPHVRERVNAPLFAFGQRAAHVAAKHAPMLEVLIAAGGITHVWRTPFSRPSRGGSPHAPPRFRRNRRAPQTFIRFRELISAWARAVSTLLAS
jgi:hypothetical protein